MICFNIQMNTDFIIVQYFYKKSLRLLGRDILFTYLEIRL